ncbi:hypothetical protein KZX37_05600 [Microbacterium sp. EYE_5]|uniref:hypothetical protein n=1 Tax=unclassified Microbacterium TaxID=2609290 RepID=UPI002006A793|nr:MULTISPECIES: hypothetical protein [unclassified Microbacterium]MCK6080095.1 hypothetical protein [Microbacterium sp. EYE_382]MCK6085366.1 hypothetical protein [Microbacterium sp. EYE_384]MCK6122409.1 hypothetical protein [Microbacterium sp. EYE_80]MCK6126129.1 hypothetical protein [Microbacterium sp. EYE_79]MCK6141050.1 hypothetical protein [Microbacterium sp. EYE_39]
MSILAGTDTATDDALADGYMGLARAIVALDSELTCGDMNLLHAARSIIGTAIGRRLQVRRANDRD